MTKTQQIDEKMAQDIEIAIAESINVRVKNRRSAIAWLIRCCQLEIGCAWDAECRDKLLPKLMYLTNLLVDCKSDAEVTMLELHPLELKALITRYEAKSHRSWETFGTVSGFVQYCLENDV
jgi:hypothetical protein